MSKATIYCLSEAVSPITHAQGTEGNESLIAREPVMTDYGICSVPYLSGNALRHCLIREPGFDYLIQRAGMSGALSLEQLNLLYHGGNLTQSTGTEDTRLIAEMQTLFPLFRLLGGALPSNIVSGSLDVDRGTLVCEENRRRLPSYMPQEWNLPPTVYFKPAEDFVSGYQYTRGDAKKTKTRLLMENEEAPAKSNLMIFSGQSVMPGAIFLHGFTLHNADQLEVGALLHSLSLWDGTIGGQASRGHGKLKTSLLGDDAGDAEAIAAYIEHVDANADDCRDWLEELFKPKTKKTAKQATLIEAG